MDSFYGGKYGASYIIKKYYESVAAMAADFSQGALYKDVAYDECVLINTVNKNDADNGKVFRRGYDYTNELGGAEYVGTIVGPSGPAPMIESVEYNDIDLNALTVQVGEETIHIDAVEKYRCGETELSKKAGNLVSGNSHDTIKYKWCSVRDNNGEDTTLYIGFQIPYTVIHFSAASVNPYYNRSDENNHTDSFENKDLAVRIDQDSDSRPFHENWKISIPKGIKGDTFKNLRVIPANDTIEEYDGQADDISGNREILVYDYYHHDKEDNGEPVSIYLGDFNMIENIEFTDNGTVTIDYSHDDTKTFNNLIRWITSVILDEKGNFTVKYNNGTPDYTTSLKWVNDIKIAEDGTITLHYSNDAEPTVLDQKFQSINDITLDQYGTLTVLYNTGEKEVFENDIQWINEISLTDAGNFIVKYNNGTPDYTTSLKWVNDIKIAEDGTITLHYSNDAEPTVLDQKFQSINDITLDQYGTLTVLYNTGEKEVFENDIQWINEISLTDAGVFTVKYNNGTPDYVKNLVWQTSIDLASDGTLTANYNNGTTAVYNEKIKWVNNMAVDTEGDQKLYVEYNNGSKEAISDPLNYIEKVALDRTNFHALVYYSDPALRQELIDAGNAVEYDGKNGWLDLGAIRDYSGILVGKNLKQEDIPELSTISGTEAYLNNTYPEGLLSDNLRGKLIVVSNSAGNELFYGFDYDTNTWFYAGELGAVDPTEFIMVDTDNAEARTKWDAMPIGSIWFVEEG